MISLSGIDDFEKKLNSYVDRYVNPRIETFVKNMVVGIYDIVTRDVKVYGTGGSPVWTGAFVSSHNVSINAIDYSFNIRPDADEIGTLEAKPLSYAKQKIAAFKLGDIAYISNSVASKYGRYAGLIEHEGLARTAPDGVYRIAVEAIKVRFNLGSLKLPPSARLG